MEQNKYNLKVIKRNKELEDFDIYKVATAIYKVRVEAGFPKELEELEKRK